jgi:hypothetical protein
LNTPPTPRFAPIDEPDRPLHKFNAQKAALLRPAAGVAPLTPAETPVNRKKQADAIQGMSHSSTGRILFPTHTPKKGVGKGRTRHLTPPKKQTTLHPPSTRKEHAVAGSSVAQFASLDEMKQRSFEIFDDTKAMKRELENDDPFDSHPINKQRRIDPHPHKPLAKEAPGMWYVFRGKKVFRPFPKGKSDKDLATLKPKRLFNAPRKRSTTTISKDDPFNSDDANKNTDPDDTEEDDTDREDDDFKRKSSSQSFFTNNA